MDEFGADALAGTRGIEPFDYALAAEPVDAPRRTWKPLPAAILCCYEWCERHEYMKSGFCKTHRDLALYRAERQEAARKWDVTDC